MADGGLVLGLLNTLERELLPAIERGESQAWGRANRVADAVLALLPEGDRHDTHLPLQRVGALQALYVEARGTRADLAARSCALYTFVTRGREALDPQRRSRPPSMLPGRRSVLPASLVSAPERTFPSWVPTGGVLGGFRLVRPMASGGLGSLFLARRVEDEGDPLAKDVVLKVPHDAAALAAYVPEEELLAQFRAVASALAAIPVHPNLARILAFDVAARPKPFLVMELVEGRTLEEELNAHPHGPVNGAGAMTTARALEILDGVLAGVDAMHATGVGHLDLKPDNVILRRGTGAATLVDFGLSGRHVRKKCGNPMYAPPEIWSDDRAPESAFAADSYSFACLAFELLTGSPLFDGEDLFGVIRQHLAHDGLPPGVASLRARPELRKLAEILSRALRANPAQRTRIRMMRTELARVAPLLREAQWPLSGASRWSSVPTDGDVSVPPASVPPSSAPSSRDLDDPDASGARPLPAVGRFDLESAFDDIPWSDCRASNTG
ncbi:MAG: eukaryotic-like serine/threonine-protein kinase [Myxococcales bacterium]|nr:eukaryotic-like serine/threonine-protein kinase [Myxococcales bacterium]